MVINPVQFASVNIPYDKVLLRLGYSRGKTKLDAGIRTILSEEVENSKKLITPHRVIASSKIRFIPPSGIVLDPSLSIKSIKIFKLLKDCSLAYGFAITIGPYLEEKRDQYLQKKEITRAMILDAIGSETADSLTELTHKKIADESLERGFSCTKRFSCGYGDWHVSGQKNFLKWLGAEQIGIKLTKHYQMLPEKSVTAIFGIKRTQNG